MNRIYLSDNYIVIDKSGRLQVFPKRESEYIESLDAFELRKFSTKEEVEIRFSEIDTWFKKDGSTAWNKDILREFLRENTSINSISLTSGSNDIALDAWGKT